MRKRGIFKIKLESDLCIGSGYSFAGVIDSDVCYDKFGIPFIPARRIKGDLREAAETTLHSIFTNKEDIEKIFGTRGNSGVKGITIENAYPENYEEIKKELENAKKSEEILNTNLSVENLLGCYTNVKAQTKIDENGVAKDLSLRYTRVVNKYSPINNIPLVFEANVFFDDNAIKEEDIKILAKALRNIGLKRNRGLGKVSCSFEGVTKLNEEDKKSASIKSDELYKIEYTIKNIEPLMMSNRTNNKTENYISGQSVLGLLANNYIYINGKASAESEEFKDLFLRGKAIYTDLTLCKNEKKYYPAPLFINQLKKTKKLVNIEAKPQKDDGKDYVADNGNQPKKLKGKFIADFGNNTFDIAQVEKDIVYHHSHRNKSESGEKGILYALEVISENQKFSGSIILPGKYIKTIEDLLNYEIRFGKSKSAQYGRCIIEKIESSKFNEKVFKASKGNTIAVSFISDGIFINNGNYTNYYEEVADIIAKQLGIKIDQISDDYYSLLQTKIIYGYQSMWNLRKAPIAGIEAGSTFVFKLAEDAVINKEFVGERNLEGYGNIKIINLDNMPYKLLLVENKTDEKNPIEFNLIKPIINKVIINSICEKLKKSTLKKFDKFDITASTLGRVTLMLKESIDTTDKIEDFSNFVDRINSIKREKEKQKIKKNILDKISENDKLSYEKIKNLADDASDEIEYLERTDKKNANNMIFELWSEVLMNLFVMQKYSLKG